jgi:DNA-binding transcriptional LysR family regulator
MELRHLRYFVAIAEERSFTRAAERLWVAQPGLSTQIRRLEAELGIQLFDRHTRGVDLTDAGALFLERARAALAAADAASATGSDLERGMVGTVRLGIATGARWHQTSALLERFTRERGEVELTVVECHGGALWRELRDGRLDALVAPSCYSSADLQRLELGTEPWVVLVGTGHRLAHAGALSASDLDGERIAVTDHRDGAGYDRAVADMLAELGVAAVLVRGGPGPALHCTVADGDALALTTAPETLHPNVIARPLSPPGGLAFQLLWQEETASPALSEFIRMAADCVERRSTVRALAAVA